MNFNLHVVYNDGYGGSHSAELNPMYGCYEQTDLEDALSLVLPFDAYVRWAKEGSILLVVDGTEGTVLTPDMTISDMIFLSRSDGWGTIREVPAMKITREINGKQVEFELTPSELYLAFEEQQEAFDKEDT